MEYTSIRLTVISSSFIQGQPWPPKEVTFAEISRKFSAVRWLNKTEDCIFPRSFILRSNMYNLSIFHHLSISQSLSQSFYTYRIVPIYLPFPEVHAPLRVSEISSELILHHKSIVLIFTETNAIKCLSHAAFMARTNAFIHVPDISARLFPICRLFLVTINDSHYLFLSVT